MSKPGDTYRSISPCAGGYGNPLERDPELVLDDIKDSFISRESACDYGVVITENLELDEEATRRLRKEAAAD